MAELDAADARAIAVGGTLTTDELNRVPAHGGWSVGQCLEHLSIANEVYVQAMAGPLNGRPVAVVEDITPGWFGRWFIRSYIAPSPQTRRAPAPKKIAPTAHVEPTVLDRFLRSNQSVRELIRRAAHHDVNRIRFRNPFIPLIWFTVGTGIEITWQHQRRHLLQAERISEALGLRARGTRGSSSQA
jgi:hypothetical protein